MKLIASLRCALAGLIAMFLVAGALNSPDIASAAGACGGFSSNYLDGAFTTTNEYSEVDSVITTKSPNLCTGPPGGYGPLSAMFVMLDSHAADRWAQVGWQRTPAGTQVFTQTYNGPGWNGGNPSNTYHPAPPVGSSSTYEVAYSSTENNIWLIGNGYVDKQYINPFAEWARPVGAEVSGETFHCGDDMPGVQSAKAPFDQIRGQLYGGAYGNLNDLSASINPPGACGGRYHNQWGAFPSLLYIWTYPQTYP